VDIYTTDYGLVDGEKEFTKEIAMKTWVNYKEIKARINIGQVLEHYGVLGNLREKVVYLQRTDNCRARNQVVYLPSILIGRGRYGTRLVLSPPPAPGIVVALRAPVVDVALGSGQNEPDHSHICQTHQETRQRAQTLPWTPPQAALRRV
jgi:hypothetical protein